MHGTNILKDMNLYKNSHSTNNIYHSTVMHCNVCLFRYEYFSILCNLHSNMFYKVSEQMGRRGNGKENVCDHEDNRTIILKKVAERDQKG